jgi:fatty acid desaturase
MFVAFVAAAMLMTGLTAGAFARDKHHRHHVTTAGAHTDPDTVYSAGQYVGRDPDARAREQMLIDNNRGVGALGGH